MHRIMQANCPEKCRPGGAGSGARQRRLPEITCGKIWQIAFQGRQRCGAWGAADSGQSQSHTAPWGCPRLPRVADKEHSSSRSFPRPCRANWTGALHAAISSSAAPRAGMKNTQTVFLPLRAIKTQQTKTHALCHTHFSSEGVWAGAPWLRASLVALACKSQKSMYPLPARRFFGGMSRFGANRAGARHLPAMSRQAETEISPPNKRKFRAWPSFPSAKFAG